MNQWNKPALGSQIDPQHPLSQGCVMALLMLEGAGNRTYDLTHNHNDGVLTNGPIWKPGRNGAAISFDGVDDYVSIRYIDKSTLQPKHITLSVWTYNSSGFLFMHGEPVNRGTSGYGLTPTYFFIVTADGVQVSSNFSASIPVDEWALLIATWDGKTMNIYVNGVNVYSAVKSGGDIVYNVGRGTTNFFMHTYSYTAAVTGGGLIPDVRIWNRALSPDEVQDLYINPYGFIYQPQKYWLMPQGVTIPPHLFRRVA